MRGINGKWKLARGAAEPMGEGLEKARLHANEPNHLEGCSKAWWTNQARHIPAEIMHMDTPMPMKANGVLLIVMKFRITWWNISTFLIIQAMCHFRVTQSHIFLQCAQARRHIDMILYYIGFSMKQQETIELTTHPALFAQELFLFKKSDWIWIWIELSFFICKLYYGFGFCSLSIKSSLPE